MPKTITLRVDDDTYRIIQTAAHGDRRTISNFLEIAAVSYIAEASFASDEEMNELVNDKKLKQKLKLGREEIKKGRYTIVG
jgi:uncharacterized protein (DUF1778 family)